MAAVSHQALLAGMSPAIVVGSVGTPYTSSSNSATYTGTGLPSVASDERGVIAIGGRNTVLRTLTSVTLGGEACSEIHKDDNGGSVVALYIAPKGATGDVVVNLDGDWLRCAIALWPCKNIRSATPTDTAESTADPLNASIDCAAGGAIFGVAFNADNGSFAWTNLTEAFDVTPESGSIVSGAADVFPAGASARSITADPSTANDRGVMALAALR